MPVFGLFIPGYEFVEIVRKTPFPECLRGIFGGQPPFYQGGQRSVLLDGVLYHVHGNHNIRTNHDFLFSNVFSANSYNRKDAIIVVRFVFV